MYNERIAMSLIFPLLSVLVITTYLGFFGGLFIFLNGNTPLEQWSVVILGVTLTLGTPTAAYLLERMTEPK